MTFKNHSDRNKNQKPQQGASTSEDMFERRRAKALGKVSLIIELWKIETTLIVAKVTGYQRGKDWKQRKDPMNNPEYIHANKQMGKCYELRTKIAKLFFMKSPCIICGSQIGTIEYTGPHKTSENWCSKCGCKIEREKHET